VYYSRLCSDFSGALTANPKTWVRRALYKSVAALKLGDFCNVIALNRK
jgi:hypothetical protein